MIAAVGPNPAQTSSSSHVLIVISLVIALLGFTLAVISLVWQVFSWRLTGSVVRVSCRRGVPVTADGILGPDLLIVEARNIGRTPVSITAAGFRLPDKSNAFWGLGSGSANGPPLPHTLPGGHSAEWQFMEAGLRDAARDRRQHEARAFVNLGTGKTVIDRKAVRFQ